MRWEQGLLGSLGHHINQAAKVMLQRMKISMPLAQPLKVTEMSLIDFIDLLLTTIEDLSKTEMLLL